MKNKIKPFVRLLILDNIFYIIGNIFLLILIVITVKIGLSENFKYDKKILSINEELNQLQNKINLMNTTVPSTEKLDEDLVFLNTLIPNVENYFSIIYALEKLSQKSNFLITSYNVNVEKSTSQKLDLSVSGDGNSQEFINFLKEYNFGGGRLITSDKIQLDPNFFGSIRINLTFYNKSVPISNNLEISAGNKNFEELEILKKKVNFDFNSYSASSTPDFNYPKKENPF